MLIHFMLVKEGYGSLVEVQEFDARTVIQALHFRTFGNDYEAAYLEINN